MTIVRVSIPIRACNDEVTIVTDDSCEIRFFAAARAAVGRDAVFTNCGNLASLLDSVREQFPQFASVAPVCSFLIDGLAVHADPADIEVAPGQCVDVLPPFAGG